MANHCYYHFKQKITIEEVAKHMQFFCKERLGENTLIEFDKQWINITIPAQNEYKIVASYWLKNSKTLENRRVVHGHSFAARIADYAAWKLKSTHITDEGISDNISSSHFSSKPLITFSDDYNSIFMNPILGFIKKTLSKNKSKFMDEDEFIKPLNHKISFYYVKAKNPVL